MLPAVAVFGLGLSFTVAPLTATVLASADVRHAGVASGVNNAVARIGGLLAVAGLPAAVGLGASCLSLRPVFSAGFQHAVLICAGLLLLGSLLSAILIDSNVLRPADGPPPPGAGVPGELPGDRAAAGARRPAGPVRQAGLARPAG